MADRLLVLVPHEHTHAPRSILEQARKLGPDVIEMRAIKHTMELIAHSLCIANTAPAKVAQDGLPGKKALLYGQSMGTKSELHQSPELTDAHWQPIVRLSRAPWQVLYCILCRTPSCCEHVCQLVQAFTGRP